MGADDTIHSLVRVEATDVDEPAPAGWNAQPLPRCLDVFACSGRPINGGWRFNGNAYPIARDPQNLFQLARRVVGDRKDQARLPESEANLGPPEHTGPRRRKSQVRETLRDRVVNGYERRQT